MPFAYDFSWVQDPAQQFLFRCFPQPSDLRFVGGSVRNTLLGVPVADFDVATIYPPEQTMSLLQGHGVRVIPTGLAHGTVTALVQEHAYEITTLRRDLVTDGRRAQVAYTDSWQQDALRRDFTMNGLYVDHRGILYDDVGGAADAASRTIRFIGDPVIRIQEDYLRILRFFRFWAWYGKRVDEKGLQAVHDFQPFLATLSGERITKEWLRFLEAPNPWPMLVELQAKGFLPWILGHEESSSLGPFLQEIEQRLGPTTAWIRLACLSPIFPRRLVLSREQTRLFQNLSKPLPFAQSIEGVYETSLAEAKGRLILQACGSMAQGHDPMDHLRECLQDLEQRVWPIFPLSGRHLIPLGLVGSQVGERLRQVKKWWIQQGCTPNLPACLHYAANIAALSS